MGRDILGPFILEMINIGTYKYMLVLCALKGQHLYNLESFANVWVFEMVLPHIPCIAREFVHMVYTRKGWNPKVCDEIDLEQINLSDNFVKRRKLPPMTRRIYFQSRLEDQDTFT